MTACAVVHFFLISAVCCRETSWLVGRGLTVVPASFKSIGQRSEKIASGALGSDLAKENPLRQAIVVYTCAAGIEGGYGFFAPNIPGSFALVFEIHYTDGRVEYEQPRVGSAATDLRVAGLLDKIGDSEYDPLREGLIKMMARSIWHRHPDARTIRAIFGSITLPDVTEFEAGKKPSFDVLYAYDFSLKSNPTKSDRP